VHELAHHWWGDAVSPASWKDIWLNEGFATYSEALYFEAESGFDALKSTMNSKYKRYFKERLYDTDGDLFSQTVYNKGAWVLHMLRKETGDSVFFKILREYFNKYKYKNASTNDFKVICEKISGKNLTHFFKQWVYDGTGIIEAEYNWTAEKKDSVFKVKLNLLQFQKEFAEYHFPLDVKLVYEGENKFVTKTVYIDSKNKKFEFDSAEKPVSITFDPDNWLLAYFVNSADKEN
jgi:Aminopeptidase N